MSVKRKTLDFDDGEKCSLNETFNLIMEKERLDKSSEKMSVVKSATSLDKVTFDDPCRKSLEMQSLEQEVSNKREEPRRVSFETCVEECVVVDEEVSELDINKNLQNAEDNSDAVVEIQHFSFSHKADVALLNVDKGPGVEMHQKVTCHIAEGFEPSPRLQVEECYEEDNQDLICIENKLDEGNMSGGLACSARTMLERKSHVGEDGLLACGSVGSLHSKEKNFSSSEIRELQLLESSLQLGRRLRSVSEDSWPQFKRRKIDGQRTNFFSASPSFRVKEIHGMGGHTMNKNVKSMEDNLETVLQIECLPVSHKGDAAQLNADKSPDMELNQKVNYHLYEGIEPSPELQLEQEMKSHFKEDGLLSYCSIESPQDKHVALTGADQTMPEFEGFIIHPEENEQPHNVGDAISFNKLDLPSTIVKRTSVLEQLCKSASRHTPLSEFSATFKLHGTPDLYQSVPNGLLEHMDLRSTLNLNDDGGKQLRASYSCVDEVKCALEGVLYSDCVPYTDAHFGKQQSLNPELTCFPIEEDPSISGENENIDKVADTIQEDISSTLMTRAKRQPLAEIKEACVNPPTSVSAAERFPDRNSLDSTNTEVNATGTQSRIKHKLGKRDIKVKALEAAEAAKRLEEKRQNERKMKKDALKLERERKEQENLRQMEINKKKKEEEQKKKDADMAARKRLKEEEKRKEKERKGKRIEEPRQQQRGKEEKLRAGKEKEVPFGAMDENVNDGKESNNELRKHQKMKKPQTDPRAAEISTSNASQVILEDCQAFSHFGDNGEVKFSSCTSPKRKSSLI
ncbi:hypothetical protein LOK49_LG06G00328 [Camellia lanceoleosa]|uniref:Uncharacterized protein n=1 Tax=Camellia lanceoleosa TaxID=1840588 RepID=A0ACC0HFV4_9ERIC|nr:hypothetical protein LOK49_LG06G00328 [Camellia lanceoleosa]